MMNSEGQRNAAQAGEGRAARLPKALTVLLAAMASAYLLQIATPLRVDHDSIEYLTVAASIADGRGFMLNGAPAFVPYGYPLLVAGLEQLGVAASWCFVLLNCLFLGLGLTCAFRVLKHAYRLQSRMVTVCMIASLSSFVLVKHVTRPATDCIFFGLFFLSLYLLVRVEEGAWFTSNLLLALLTIFVAINFRRVGIALVPALLYALRSKALKQPALANLVSRFRYALIGLSIIVLIIVAAALFRTRQFQGALDAFDENGGAKSLLLILQYRITELGELVLNLPATRLSRLSPFLFILFGPLLVMMIAKSLHRHRHCPTVTDIALLAYIGTLFLWPFYDPRFWMPCIPILAAIACSELWQPASVTAGRRIAQGYFGWLILTGLAALAFTTRITFSGSNFANLYGDRTLQPSYEYAFKGRAEGKVIDEAVAVIKRYGGPRNPSPAATE
ncbi:MAG TPA: hypothetical protein VJ464_07995 [Blastocatellia bacterium]|nr:hypothetical protein [Blastocatellia bacterium]